MSELLRIEPNERIDLADFEHAVTTGFAASKREPFEFLLTNPTSAKRTWILEGFDMSNPAGKQLQVNRGTAILALREKGTTRYGALLTKGDATKVVDLSAYSAGSYGIYIRFEYVAGKHQSRIFWNPAGLGSEYAKTIATRLSPNWSLRVELSNPGAEWTRIGTVDQATMAISDLRDFYFEGKVSDGYATTWGGGDDRNDDRQQHGIRDFQTFTGAMRTIVEELRGGDRRWWQAGQVEAKYERGLSVGHTGATYDDRVSVGDGSCFLENNGSEPRLLFDSLGDGIYFDRTTDIMRLGAGSASQGRLHVHPSQGLSVTDTAAGLDVAMGASTPVGRHIRVGDPSFRIEGDDADHKRLTFDEATGPVYDRLEYDRIDDELRLFIGSTQEHRWDSLGAHIRGGLSVGNAASSTIADKEIEVGDPDYRFSGGDSNLPRLQWDDQDEIRFDRSTNQHQFIVGNTEELRVQASGVIANGLGVGDITLTPSAGRLKIGDDSYYLRLSTDPLLHFDSNDYLQYDRSANELMWKVSGATRAILESTGVRAHRLAAGSATSAGFSSPDPGGYGSISVKSAGQDPAYLAFQESDLGSIGSYPEQYWRLRGDSGDLVWEVNTHLATPFSSVSEILRVQPAGGLSVSALTTTTAVSVGTTLTATNIESSGGANIGGTFSGYLSRGIKVGDDDFQLVRATGGSKVLPTIVFDATGSDFLRYDRTDKQLTMFIGGNEMFRFHPNANAADVRLYLGNPADKTFFETKTNEYAYAYSRWHLTDDGTYHDYIDLYKSGGTDLTWRFVEANDVKWVLQTGVFRPSSTNYTLGSSTYEFATVYGRHYASNLSSAPTIGFHSERKSVYCGSTGVTELPWLGTRAHHNQGSVNYTIGIGGDPTSTSLSWLMWYTTSTPTNDVQGMTLNRMFRFEWTGNAYGDNWYTSGADLAEVWQKHEDGLEPGNLLVLHRDDDEHLGISQKPNDPQIVGVFSTKPGFTLDGTDKTLTTKPGVPLALIGKAPVKVCNENGPIRPGDPLTSASRPGYAMKAIRSGRILGRALQAFDRKQGQVTAFVNCQDWINPAELTRLHEQIADLQRQIQELRSQP